MNAPFFRCVSFGFFTTLSIMWIARFLEVANGGGEPASRYFWNLLAASVTIGCAVSDLYIIARHLITKETPK